MVYESSLSCLGSASRSVKASTFSYLDLPIQRLLRVPTLSAGLVKICAGSSYLFSLVWGFQKSCYFGRIYISHCKPCTMMLCFCASGSRGQHAKALCLQAKFSPDFVKQMVLHFIIAGRDTTACLLSWMFYELCRNQDVQLQLHEEIMKKLPPGTPMDWKSLSAGEMPYLNLGDKFKYY